MPRSFSTSLIVASAYIVATAVQGIIAATNNVAGWRPVVKSSVPQDLVISVVDDAVPRIAYSK